MEGGFIIGRRARYNRGIRIFSRKKNRRDYAYYNSVNFVSKRNDYFINKRCFIASIDDTKHLIDFGLWMNIYIYTCICISWFMYCFCERTRTRGVIARFMNRRGDKIENYDVAKLRGER